MTTRRRLLALPLAAGLAPLLARAAIDPNDALRASDAVRNPGRPYQVKLTLTEYEGGKQVDASTLATYSRELEGSGQFATLAAFVAPARDAGKLMLRSGDDMWFFDPSTKASVRLSPQQRLMGQASNGDVMTVNLARDYRAKLLAEEDISDGERKQRHALKLGLTAAGASASYATIESWVAQDSIVA